MIYSTERGRNVDFDGIEGIEKYILEMYTKWEKGVLTEFKITEDIKAYDRKILTKKLSDIFLELTNKYNFLLNESKNNYNDLNKALKEKIVVFIIKLMKAEVGTKPILNITVKRTIMKFGLRRLN